MCEHSTLLVIRGICAKMAIIKANIRLTHCFYFLLVLLFIYLVSPMENEKMSLNCSDYVGKRVAWHEVGDCTGLVVGYADFSEMPACLRSVDSPDFDLLILQDGESHPEYVSGAYKFEVIG